MALFPLISNFQYDFVLQLVAVDSENTMDEVAVAAAHHSVGRRVAPQPGKVVRVRRQGATEFFPQKQKLSATGIKPMECLEFIFADAP
jgi:toluene monooxygenase system protein B